jgi:NAD-dependent deacetylase
MAIDKAQLAAQMINESSRIVVFTGAGISTESGIPDFRSPGGIWSKYSADDLTYQRFRASEENRKIYWKYDRERYPAMKQALPNDAHNAVVELERMGKLLGLITQNIDGLHGDAGSSRDLICELHGTVREVGCLDCHTRWPREEITEMMEREGIEVPYCEHCGGPLKVATIAFGQAMPEQAMARSFELASQCDLFITVGSSLVVQPANLLPTQAKRSGAKLILINLSRTPYDEMMDLIIIGKAGESMARIMAELGSVSRGD